MRLRQASACFYGTGAMSVGVAGYTPNQFIGALDLEKAGNLGASHSDFWCFHVFPKVLNDFKRYVMHVSCPMVFTYVLAESMV